MQLCYKNVVGVICMCHKSTERNFKVFYKSFLCNFDASDAKYLNNRHNVHFIKLKIIILVSLTNKK